MAKIDPEAIAKVLRNAGTEVLAIAILIANPTIKLRDIADVLNISRATLYRFYAFKTAYLYLRHHCEIDRKVRFLHAQRITVKDMLTLCKEAGLRGMRIKQHKKKKAYTV